MWDLVGNPEDRFSQNEAQIVFGFKVSSPINLIIVSSLPVVYLSNCDNDNGALPSNGAVRVKHVNTISKLQHTVS